MIKRRSSGCDGNILPQELHFIFMRLQFCKFTKFCTILLVALLFHEKEDTAHAQTIPLKTLFNNTSPLPLVNRQGNKVKEFYHKMSPPTSWHLSMFYKKAIFKMPSEDNPVLWIFKSLFFLNINLCCSVAEFLIICMIINVILCFIDTTFQS